MRGRSRERRNIRSPVVSPLQISGLKSWFDSTYTAGFTFSSGTSISAWASRAGSMGSVSWTQGTADNQATLASGVSTLGNQSAVLFDGSNDYFDSSTTNGWAFLHNGTGASIFAVLRVDSTGGATQTFMLSNNASNAEIGVFWQYNAANVNQRVGNGSGTWLNLWSNSTAAHYAKDVSRWQAWGYVDGTQTSAVSGSTLTNTDAVGQDPSASNPSRTLRLGAGVAVASPCKMWLAQLCFFDHVLSAAEMLKLGSWASQLYGVSR